MKHTIRNFLSLTLLPLFIILNNIPLVLAQAESSGDQTSFPTIPGPVGIIVVWMICNSKKHKAIGGWLLYYYMQLFVGTIVSIIITLLSIETLAESMNIEFWDNNITQYSLYLLSTFPSYILLAIELVVASMLLSKKFRNKKMYNILRITLASQFLFALIATVLDAQYWPENLPFDILAMIIAIGWFIYFTRSRRAKMVFIEKRWDPNILHPPKENIVK